MVIFFFLYDYRSMWYYIIMGNHSSYSKHYHNNYRAYSENYIHRHFYSNNPLTYYTYNNSRGVCILSRDIERYFNDYNNSCDGCC